MFSGSSRSHRSAAAVLFPELAGAGSAFAQGLLRAPQRGRKPAPVLSLLRRAERAGGAADGSAPDETLSRRGWEDAALLERARAARQALVAAGVGGPWWEEPAAPLPAGEGYALVALTEPANGGGWQPLADHCVGAAMLDRALAEHRPDRLLVAAAGRMDRRLRARLARIAAQGAAIIDKPFDPWPVLERSGRVYSAGGEIGFLALLAGVAVSAFSGGFYTGWGVTTDDRRVPRREFLRTVDEIFAGVCLLATRYRDPFRNTVTSLEDTLELLAGWRRLERQNRSVVSCVGMSFWKRRRVVDFIRSGTGMPPFHRDAADALAAAEAAGGAIAGWASRLPDGLAEEARRRSVPLIRVEDGFIRSVGLGSDFLPPASLVFDRGGMYYDPRSDSDLIRLLRTTDFPAPLLARAHRLAGLLVARGVTKYNLPASAADAAMTAAPVGLRYIVVPGQVEDDLSILHGAGAVRTNLDLLAEVRRANPDAYVIYKPHPDVLAGHRIGAVPDEQTRQFADAVVAGGSLPGLLARADELHTMTSLAGFEALLRGRRVVVYGRPFYAGWGLTEDRPEFDRGRRLTIAELVAAALILYPRYLDPMTRLPCDPEIIIERLDRPELWRAGPLVAARRLQGRVMRKLYESRGGSRQVHPPAARQLREPPRA